MSSARSSRPRSTAHLVKVLFLALFLTFGLTVATPAPALAAPAGVCGHSNFDNITSVYFYVRHYNASRNGVVTHFHEFAIYYRRPIPRPPFVVLVYSHNQSYAC